MSDCVNIYLTIWKKFYYTLPSISSLAYLRLYHLHSLILNPRLHSDFTGPQLYQFPSTTCVSPNKVSRQIDIQTLKSVVYQFYIHLWSLTSFNLSCVIEVSGKTYIFRLTFNLNNHIDLHQILPERNIVKLKYRLLFVIERRILNLHPMFLTM